MDYKNNQIEAVIQYFKKKSKYSVFKLYVFTKFVYLNNLNLNNLMLSLKSIMFVLCVFYLQGSLFSQKEANLWYFGHNAGLDFSSGNPVPLTNSKMFTDEGSASISDASGNLLFYTDGVAVWNRLHDTMPNGKNLYGDPSSTQSSVIIKKPGTMDHYYIFTANDGFKMFTTPRVYKNPLCYTEVDMSANGGLGDVIATKKNVVLFDSTCEKITGVRHCNNTDVWVITHDYGTNGFRTFKVTESGVNATPIKSYVGPIIDTGSYDFAGQLKAYTTGKKLAMACLSGSVALFDFNQSTGAVSNPIIFNPTKMRGGTYGAEFSPDGTKLYASTYYTPAVIYQMDLCAGSGDSTSISESPIEVGNSSSSSLGSLQLGPDNKIYVARWDENYGGLFNTLGRISNPNAFGVACGFSDNAVSLGGKYSGVGLPNFVPYNLKPIVAPFTSTINCLTGIFTAPIVNETNCSVANSAIVTQIWDFGDPVTGSVNTSTLSNPTHVFSNPGTYTVTLNLNYACGNDVIKQTVIAIGPVATVESDVMIDLGNSTQLTVTGNGSYVWTTGETNSIITVSPTITTVYCATVTDVFNCKNDACATVTVRMPIEIPNAFSPNGDGINDVWHIIGIETYAKANVSLYNRWGQPILYKDDYKNAWDGKFNGNDLPTASYYYVVDINDGEFIYKGYVTLKR